MKKILLFIMMFLVCGCGNKLKCTYSENYEDIKISNSIEFNFKTNEYEQIDKMTFKTKKDAEEYFDDIKEYIEEYNLVLNDKEIVSKIKKQMEEDLTKNELKKRYESYDYRCR